MAEAGSNIDVVLLHPVFPVIYLSLDAYDRSKAEVDITELDPITVTPLMHDLPLHEPLSPLLLSSDTSPALLDPLLPIAFRQLQLHIDIVSTNASRRIRNWAWQLTKGSSLARSFGRTLGTDSR